MEMNMANKNQSNSPRVAVLGGSTSDFPVLEKGVQILNDLGIPNELRVVSAHRTPDWMFEYAETAESRGIQVIIAGAGGSAHLPGMLAAKTVIPVIGVPIALEHLKGMDSLLSIVQMPRGVPVATVAIGGSENAAILAAEILSVSDLELRECVKEWKQDMRDKVLKNPSAKGFA